MEHSVQAYLRRLPTPMLEKFLQDYRNNQHSEDFSEMIGSVLQELERRRQECCRGRVSRPAGGETPPLR